MNVHSLEVLEFPRVVGILRGHTLSPLGAALVDRMVPLTSLERIREDQAKLSEMLGLIERKGNIPLADALSLRGMITRSVADGAILDAKELLDVLRMARMADDAAAILKGEAKTSPKLAALGGGLEPVTSLQMEISRKIDEEGSVVDWASPELAAIRSEIASTREEVRKVLDRYIQSKAAKRSLQEGIITLRNGRYVLPVKEEERRMVEGIVHDHSGSGATVFVEPIETVERNNRLARLKREEMREVRRILRELTDRVRLAAGELQRNEEILGRLDFLQAKALFARATGGAIPRVGGDEPLRIVDGRHPLLERSLTAAGRGEELVPLGLALPEESRTLVLTGPNAGGKTVTLKTVGLFVLMAQAGLALPVGEGTTLPLFEKVFADIGDEQSIDNSLSSFSARLRRMVGMLGGVGRTSLVLIDEIGSGTDPAEGAALSMALLEEIHGRGATSVVTTHLGSLKVFVHDHAGMENACMEFDSERLWPTYRLEIGLPGTSHALEIAARLGLEESVIEKARLYVGDSVAEVESLLTDLKSRGKALREAEETLDIERARLKKTGAALEERENALRLEERKWKSQGMAEAKRFLEESRALVEKVVRELREKGGDRESVASAHEAMEKQREELHRALAAAEEMDGGGDGGAVIGRTVYVKSLKRNGKVIGEGNRRGRVFVESAGIRLEVPLEDLGPASGEGKKKRAKAPTERPLPEARYELDLRGLTAEEAVAVMEKFLDQAVLSGLPSVRIIHGIGTGVLRREVASFLADDPRVSSFQLGESLGDTVAEMGS